MLLVRNLRLHVAWIFIVACLVVGGAAWQAISSHQLGRSVGGSSLVGLVVGSVAALIILFELFLWPRKKLRKYRLGRTKHWMAGHIWLGLATGPLAFIHSGYRFGGTFSTVLMYLLLFVLASGLYGWLMQIVIPRWLLSNLPSETIASQIDDVCIQNALDARRMLTVAYGAKPANLAKLANLDEATARFSAVKVVGQDVSFIEAKRQIVVGAVQRRGPDGGRSNIDRDVEVDPADANRIWKEYSAVIEVYLLRNVSEISNSSNSLTGETTNSESDRAKIGDRRILKDPRKSKSWFLALREVCSLSSAPIIDRLEEFCDQKRQYETQRRAQAWLHSWIAVHASVSVLLGILLVVHIILAIRYM